MKLRVSSYTLYVSKLAMVLYLLVCGAFSFLGCTMQPASSSPRVEVRDTISMSTIGGCGNLCWQGITVGKTTDDDVEALLRQSSYIAGDTISVSEEIYEAEPTTYYSAGLIEDTGSVAITLSKGKVAYIQLQWKNPQELGHIISILGEPNFITSTILGDLNCYATSLLQSAQSIVYHTIECDLQRYQQGQLTIDSNSEVFGVVFTEPEWIGTELYSQVTFAPWQGYGGYSSD